MSFLRHGESIDPMIGLPLGASSCAHSQRSSASMSSSRLFLGRLLSSRAGLRFVGCERFSKTKPRRTMTFQRTATTPLTSCLSPRVQSMPPLSPAPPIPAERLRFAQSRLTIPDTCSTITVSASLRSDCCSLSLRNAVRLATGMSVHLHRNTQAEQERALAEEQQAQSRAHSGHSEGISDE